MKTQKRLAKLTKSEDAVWVESWWYHKGNKKTNKQADKLAWRDLCAEFPRLQKFNGCKP